MDGATYSVYLGESSSNNGALLTTSFITVCLYFTHINNTNNSSIRNAFVFDLTSCNVVSLFPDVLYVWVSKLSSQSYWLSVFKYSECKAAGSAKQGSSSTGWVWRWVGGADSQTNNYLRNAHNAPAWSLIERRYTQDRIPCLQDCFGLFLPWVDF